MCNHLKKVRSSQAAIPVLNWVKQFFPVSIVKETFMDVKIFHENVTKKEVVF